MTMLNDEPFDALAAFLDNEEQHRISLSGTGAVYRLEKRFASLVEQPYALAISNATMGLWAIFLALGIRDADVWLDKLFWLRVGLGVLAGSLSAIIGSGPGFSDESSRVGLGFGIMIILFIVSYVIAKSLRIPIAVADKKKLITTGYGSYFLMFIFCWILVNTLIHPDVGIVTVR